MAGFDGPRALAQRREARIGIEAHAIAQALGVTLAELRPRNSALTLRDIRCALGLTQAEIAAKVGLA
ncbi:hypothetical protein GCM10010260_83160 [Streptomyces filipinensis]|uniref:Uncharacterized protein n=1 Tax=Streptomyces filipinensis TaxID=66887 RepID=A0A918IKE7_9ACTN|nr:hypothetical protein GCM10010260_83160 [Streptomyces filipinensis]